MMVRTRLTRGTSLCLLIGALAIPTSAEAICGDGTVDVLEACDDGNTLDGDCCSADCLTADPRCGTDLDHFRCYQTKKRRQAPRFTPQLVTLSDQFESNIPARVIRPRRFCNPADKNGEGILDDTAHLTCYKAKDDRRGIGRFDARFVEVTNQFGTQRLRISRPTQLCLPSEKGVAPDPPQPSTLEIDHFRCYKAKALPGEDHPEVDVSLTDQFETREFRTRGCVRFCTPVDKNGEGILNPAAHLTCFRLTDTSTLPPVDRFDINVRNQFGDQSLSTRRISTLCVPSLKVVIGP